MADEKDTAVDAETTEAVATEVVAEVAAEKPAKAEKPKAEKKPYVRIVPRLQKRYRAEIKAELMKDFNFKNIHQVPGLTKIVVNMGVGEAAKDGKLIDGAVKEMTAITGQKPKINLATTGNWLSRDPSRRSHVGVSRQIAKPSSSSYSRLPWP